MSTVAAGAALAEVVPAALVATECPFIEQAPVIDGDLTDKCWRQAAWLTDFVRLNSDSPVQYQTDVAVACDEISLYVAARAVEPDPDAIVAECATRDGPVWTDDSLEIFIDARHDHKNYVQIIVNSTGTVFDAKNKDKAWNGDIEAAGKVARREWRAELSVSFESLGVTPAEGQVIGVNFCREDHVRNDLSSWAPVKASFQAPALFGHVILESNFTAAVRDIRQRLGHGADVPITVATRRGRVSLAGETPTATTQLLEQLSARIRKLRLDVTTVDGEALVQRLAAVVQEYASIQRLLKERPPGDSGTGLRAQRRLEGVSAQLSELETAVRLAVIFAK